MTEKEWLGCADPAPMLEFWGTRPDVRKRRLFAVACCRRVVNVMTDPGRKAVNAAEAFADCEINQWELHTAWRGVGFPKAERRQYASAAARAASVSPGNDLTAQSVACAVYASVKKGPPGFDDQRATECAAQTALLRDIFGNPFRPDSFSPLWCTDTAVSLAHQMYESREFGAMPILADALQDAGCDNDDVLDHCRAANQVHVRGCWVVDLVLGKA